MHIIEKEKAFLYRGKWKWMKNRAGKPKGTARGGAGHR